MASTSNTANRKRRGSSDKQPARTSPARKDATRQRTWGSTPSTPGRASLGMRNPSPPPAHPDTHTAQYGDDPREAQWEADRAHLRHFERRPMPNANARPPKGYVRSDDRIRDAIAQVLTDSHDVDATDIDFAVKDGDVVLSGYVPDRRQRFIAEELVSRCRGVRDVVNSIRLQPWRERAVGHRS